MAHKTLIGGTAYEISGGKTLVNGTAYSIKNGKTLVGGTAYDVGFAPDIANITVVCKDYTGGGFAQIEFDDKTYSSIDREIYQIEVPIGTDIHCMIYDEQMVEEGEQYGYIKLNGVNKEEAKLFGWDFGYSYTVNGNAIIELLTDDYHYGYGRITITEIPEGYVLVKMNGAGNPTYCYVTIDGTNDETKYYSEGALGVPIGTVIHCVVNHPSTGTKNILVNGVSVGAEPYDYVVNSNTNLTFGYVSSTSGISNIMISNFF